MCLYLCTYVYIGIHIYIYIFCKCSHTKIDLKLLTDLYA